MANITAIEVVYEGRHTKGAFITADMDGDGGWEALVDGDELLPGLLPGSVLQFVRAQVPVEKQEEGPAADINLVAQYEATVDGLIWDSVVQAGGYVAPVFQMTAPAAGVAHTFFVEFGRKHSRTR
jgi:hypothetical protein